MHEDQIQSNSLNISEIKLQQLKEILPEVFSEGRIDTDKLKIALGEQFFIKDEHYELSWAGKTEAYKVLQQPTTATLAPVESESVNFDTTENIFIEGENLEVLKILQKSYFGKIKMIYIDPPYNTGNDSFIYPDKFSESKDEYLKRIGTKDEEGYLTKDGFFRKNSKDNGHYHSNWLSMMYPRLYLARNLLRDDGVIFVSIDDNEVHNLRAVMNEIFGEENFVGEFIWNKKSGRQNDARFVSKNHEYVLCYCRSEEIFDLNLLPRTDERNSEFENIDNDPRGEWIHRPLHAKSGKESSLYDITFPNGITWRPPKGTYPRFSKERLMELYNEKRLWFGKEGTNVPRYKRFLTEVKDGIITNTLLFAKEVGNTQLAKEDYRKIMPDVNFDNPKPIMLLKYILNIGSDSNDVVLDFFSVRALQLKQFWN
jgi:adenine-specific DNA-methyltransferase